MERYVRQTMLPEIGYNGQQKLQNSSVLIVGVGGLGSPIALYLAAAGVGKLGLIDGDIVSVHNLQRQVLYVENEVGHPKVLCARKRLEALSSQVKIETYNQKFDATNAMALVAEYDIIVDGCDNFHTRYLINDTCCELGKPYVYGAISEFDGQVSVFNYQGGWTYRDLFPNEQLLTSKPHTELGVMGTVPAVIGSLEAGEVIKIITGCGEVLSNKIFSINLLTMQSDLLAF